MVITAELKTKCENSRFVLSPSADTSFTHAFILEQLPKDREQRILPIGAPFYDVIIEDSGKCSPRTRQSTRPELFP